MSWGWTLIWLAIGVGLLTCGAWAIVERGELKQRRQDALRSQERASNAQKLEATMAEVDDLIDPLAALDREMDEWMAEQDRPLRKTDNTDTTEEN